MLEGDTPVPVLELPLKVQGLCLARHGKNLLDHLSFSLGAGSLSLVMGANGAGKSVLLRTLHGLLVADSGTISWNGRPLCSNLRQQQAMVFQKPVLLRRSVAANLDYVIQQRGAVDIELRNRLLREIGLEKRAVQPARSLSGGEQQRLALARALALKPRVLFLDEPTANLDPASVASFEALVLAVHRSGTKVVFVSHDIGQARRLADDIVFLENGRVAEHTAAATFFDVPQSAAADCYLNGQLYLA